MFHLTGLGEAAAPLIGEMDMTTTTTLKDLIAKYAADGFFFMDRGNGCAWGEAGEIMGYDADTAEWYGDVELHPVTEPHIAGNGQAVEFLSDWIDGQNGYSYRIGF